MAAARWRERLHEIIFESDTFAGKAFDIVLIVMIIGSIGLVMMDSVASLKAEFGKVFYVAEWFFTVIFTVEFILRLIAIHKPVRYVFSFYGIVDFLAILPTYLSFLFPGSQSFLVIRVFRLLRIFRVFKLGVYLGEADVLRDALRQSRHKIIVFLLTVLTIVVVTGTMMYVVEGEEHGYTSIPKAIYWSIVTMTTVGFGDITPKTPLGQFLASCLMIVGYGVLAVPTGIVTTELVKASRMKQTGQACPNCGAQGHDADAIFCKFCGTRI
jgi:voltage-gated potassium channel